MFLGFSEASICERSFKFVAKSLKSVGEVDDGEVGDGKVGDGEVGGSAGVSVERR